MVLIIGYRSGEYSIFEERRRKFSMNFLYRTSQEELRHYSNNNTSPEMVSNGTESSSLNENVLEDSNASGLLSTETLIYIHGGLMGALFTVALLR